MFPSPRRAAQPPRLSLTCENSGERDAPATSIENLIRNIIERDYAGRYTRLATSVVEQKGGHLETRKAIDGEDRTAVERIVSILVH